MGLVTKCYKYNAVRRYVEKERCRRKIKKLWTESLPEGSCIGVGEFFNLVERQLLYTKDGLGDWSALSSPEVLDGVYEYVTKGKRG